MLYAKISNSIFREAESGTLINFHINVPNKAASPDAEFLAKHGKANWVTLNLETLPEIRTPIKTLVDERTMTLYDEVTNGRRTYRFSKRKFVKRGNLVSESSMPWAMDQKTLTLKNTEGYYNCFIKRSGAIIFEHNDTRFSMKLAGISYFDLSTNEYRVFRKTDNIFHFAVKQSNKVLVPFDLGLFVIEATTNGLNFSLEMDTKLRHRINTASSGENGFGIVFKILTSETFENTEKVTTNRVKILQKNSKLLNMGKLAFSDFEVMINDEPSKHKLTQYVSSFKGSHFLSFVTDSEMLKANQDIKLGFEMFVPIN